LGADQFIDLAEGSLPAYSVEKVVYGRPAMAFLESGSQNSFLVKSCLCGAFETKFYNLTIATVAEDFFNRIRP
jgi:hypothetical protein